MMYYTVKGNIQIQSMPSGICIKEKKEDAMHSENQLFTGITCLAGERIILRKLTPADAAGLKELTEDLEVYRYLPTFLFEKKYADMDHVINRLYDECLQESLILGIFLDNDFCGLAELYGYQRDAHKLSIGYRLLKRYWGMGIACETVHTLVNHLFGKTEIQLITASTMAKNLASANVLKKNGFVQSAYVVSEDWGFEQPVSVDKWQLRRD